jgi:hypothetical protein
MDTMSVRELTEGRPRAPPGAEPPLFMERPWDMTWGLNGL